MRHSLPTSHELPMVDIDRPLLCGHARSQGLISTSICLPPNGQDVVAWAAAVSIVTHPSLRGPRQLVYVHNKYSLAEQ